MLWAGVKQLIFHLSRKCLLYLFYLIVNSHVERIFMKNLKNLQFLLKCLHKNWQICEGGPTHRRNKLSQKRNFFIHEQFLGMKISRWNRRKRRSCLWYEISERILMTIYLILSFLCIRAWYFYLEVIYQKIVYSFIFYFVPN